MLSPANAVGADMRQVDIASKSDTPFFQVVLFIEEGSFTLRLRLAVAVLPVQSIFCCTPDVTDQPSNFANLWANGYFAELCWLGMSLI